VQQWRGVRETSTGKFGPREIVDHGKKLSFARREMTHCAKVAYFRGHRRKRYNQDNVI
jgi:hypothetical protein